MTSAQKIVLGVLLLFTFVIAPLYVFIVIDERLACYSDNYSRGYWGSGDFSSDIKRTDADKFITFEVTTPSLQKICVISMYAVGEPYESKDANDAGVDIYARKACWRDLDSKVTLVGVESDGTIRWAQTQRVSETTWPRFKGNACAGARSKLECDRTATCSFVGPNE